MRISRSLSSATATALVLGVLAASEAQAGPTPGTGVVSSAAPVGGSARAAGLIVTGDASNAVIRAAAAVQLAGEVTISGVARATAMTRVIGFDEPVPAGVAERVADQLDLRSDITSVEPDYVRSAADASPVAVNDPLFGQQANIWDTARPGGGHSTRAPAFWVTTMGSPSVRVAVLDTGSTPHPDLTWSAGHDVVDNDADPTDPGSLQGGSGDFHGTHVAGTVAARANNGRGVAGVAPGVSIVPVRVLDGDGDGTDSAIAEGIRWASGITVRGWTNPAPVQIITMSLAGPGACTSALATAISAARSRGIVVVAAAGNSNADAAGFAPASCPGVITVGATDAGGARASFSNRGAVVDISAPGVGVLSTVRVGSTYGYQRWSGTSMAAPAVAGAAGLLASTGLTGTQIEAALPRMVTPATSPGTAGVLDLRPGPPAGPAVRAASSISTSVSMRVASRVERGQRAVVRVRLRSSTGARPSGRIRVFDGRKIVRGATVSSRRNGNLTVKTPRLHRRGVHRITVVYLGSGPFDGSRSVTRKVRVR